MVPHTEFSARDDVIRLANRICRERIAPHATETDRYREFPWDAVRVLGEVGLLGVSMSEAHGGIGGGRLLFASVVKEIAAACASTALVYVSNEVSVKAVEASSDQDLKEKWLPEILQGTSVGAFAVHESDCGSNAGAITTRAVRRGDYYVVNGSKFFVTSGKEAGIYLVLVRTDLQQGTQGFSTLLIEKDTPGLSFGRTENKMGLSGSSSTEMFLSDCRVPAGNLVGKEGEGLQVIGETVVGWGFFGAAALSVGIASAAGDIAIRHSKERTIAGQPIGVHQAVQFMITDMVLGTEAAAALLNACAAEADSSPQSAIVCGLKAKLFASEAAVDVCNKAIQVLGGHGYCREYLVERLFRDARGLMLHFKTSEWLRQDIAKATLGL
jgi:butyryl-CoA dehydrogenase